MIVRTRDQGQVELRSFALTDMLSWGYTGLRDVYTSVTDREAKGVPALYRAAQMRAEAVANLRLRCWSGDGQTRVRRDTVWQALLFDAPANEYQTRFVFWDTVGESMAWRNNAYIWKNVDPLTQRITEWYALHPDQVRCLGAGMYEVTITDYTLDPVGRGPAKYEVDMDTLLHIRGHGDGGTLEAPTPIQVFRDAISAPVLRQQHEVRMWKRGTALQLAVEFPAGVRQQEATKWKDMFKDAFQGTSGDTTLVVGGGAVVKPIGMTVADAQFADMAHLTIEDASRIMGVPGNLLGVQVQRSVPNLEQDLATWLRFGLGPQLSRIESALVADQQLFGGAHTYPAFDTDQFVRGDVLTEAQVLVSLVQVGILTPDEARRIRGLDDLPNGLGKIPQVTPVGGAPNQLVAGGTSNGSTNDSGDTFN